jgi:hypothetical protein
VKEGEKERGRGKWRGRREEEKEVERGRGRERGREMERRWKRGGWKKGVRREGENNFFSTQTIITHITQTEHKIADMQWWRRKNNFKHPLNTYTEKIFRSFFFISYLFLSYFTLSLAITKQNLFT